MVLSKSMARHGLNVPIRFLPWLAEELGRRNFVLDGFSPTVIDQSGRRQKITGIALTLAASQRFIFGADSGIPFLGAQPFDLDPLSEIAWDYADLQPRDAYGSAWLRLYANPVRFVEIPQKETGIKPMMLGIPLSPRLVEKIKIAPKADHIVLRRIKVDAQGVLLGIGQKNIARIILHRAQ